MKILRPLAVLLALALGGCVYTPLEPLGAERSTQALDADEAYLWKKTREIQFEIEASGLVFEDPGLDAYLDAVLRRVTPDELLAAGVEPRVEVISDVRIHGYSFANGVIYLHTALLSRMDDETQLATVLSRELAHVIGRHALSLRREEKARADTMAWLGVGATVSDAAGGAKLLAQAFAVSSALGFPQALEVRADEKGLAILAAAGYDVRETPAFFEGTLEYLEEVHAQGPWAWAPFSPPAPMTARIAGYRALIERDYADARATRPPIADPASFRRKVHPATKRQAELEMAGGLFVSAERTARLATESGPRDPEAWLLLGEALQGQRDKPLAGHEVPSIRRVRAAYLEALEIDGRHAAATRELGLSFYRKTSSVRPSESSRQALEHLRRYLSIAPEASDAGYIRGYVEELQAELRSSR